MQPAKANTLILLVFIFQSVLLLTAAAGKRQHICSHKHENNQYNRYRIKPGPRQLNPVLDSAASRRNHTSAHEQHKRQVEGSPFSEKFNMFIYYDDSVNSGLSSNVRTRLQKTIVPHLTKYFDSVLSVRPLKGPILVDRSCTGGSFLITDTDVRYCAYQCEETTTCGTATVPSDHLKRCAQCNGARVLSQCTESGKDGPGVDASFILYVSAKTAGSCPRQQTSEGTVAYAGSCGQEEDYDRPIVGYANFCPYSLNDDVTDDFIIAVAKHEILHALGFSDGLYAYYRDDSGKPRTPRDSNGQPPFDGSRYVPSEDTFKDVTYRDWDTRTGTVTHTVYHLNTPKIVDEGKKYFGCSNLEGVEVENQGGSGTALSHWEKRILENEGMTGIVSHNPKFTRLTFALLEDSGWYKVDYSYAEQMVWGANSGCDFSSGSCKQYMDSQGAAGIEPFCNYLSPSNGDTGCSYDRTAVSQCNMVGYTSSLPSDYQYFNTWANYDSRYDKSAVGGQTQIADFCPYQSAYSNGQCDDTNNSKGTGISNALAETYGQGSRCVVHGSKWKAVSGSYYIQQSAIKSGCYKYSCSSGKVYIEILGKKYTCSSRGTKIDVSQTTNGVTYTGSIVCPSCSEICYDDPKGCPHVAAGKMFKENTGNNGSKNIL